MRKRKRWGKGSTDVLTVGYVVFMVAVVIVASVMGFMQLIYRPIDKTGDIREIYGEVTRVAVKNEGKSKGKYLVFTENENGEMQVLEVSDSWLKGRFNSSDVWGNIKEGKAYKFTVGGSRNEFWSWYPNIYEVEEIEKEE